jgi:GNAT superfamily N-acetyltransferase
MGTVARIAARDDVTALAQLRRSWTTEVGAAVEDPRFAATFAAWLERQQGHRTFWIADDEGHPVGMVNLLTIERMPRPGLPTSQWGHLGNLYVLPDHRLTGVGTQLVTALLATAAQRGLERVLVHPNERSLPFWRRTAFVVASDLLVHEPGAHGTTA